VLADELEEAGVTPAEFARQIRVPPDRISEIIAGNSAITGDAALRFGHWFGTDPRFWIHLQNAWELRVATDTSGGEIANLPVRANLPGS
jgi:addiction module HigA family antidote